MNEPVSLRGYVQDMLANLDNPNYVQPTFPPYTPPAPKHVPIHARHTLPARKEHKVYTMPPVGAPSIMSVEQRQSLNELFAGLENPIDPDVVESAVSASEGNRERYERARELSRIADENVAKVAELRDAHRYKDVMATPAAAISKLNEIPVQGKFVVPDHMAHNMQALVSKRNQKEHGKRFKTARVNGDKSFLQVWRTR